MWAYSIWNNQFTQFPTDFYRHKSYQFITRSFGLELTSWGGLTKLKWVLLDFLVCQFRGRITLVITRSMIYPAGIEDPSFLPTVVF